MHFRSEAKLLPKDLLRTRWEREKKRQELAEKPPEADFPRIQKDPALRSQVIVKLEAIINDPTTDFDPTDLQAMMNRWNAAGAKVLSRDKRKSSSRCFELSAEVLLPAIEEKKRATKKFYQIGDASSKLTLTFAFAQSHPTRLAILILIFMLLIFVLTDANEATYSIEFGSNFSL